MTTLHMEILLMQHFNIRQNLIVPNISWGMFNHEVDLLIVRPSLWATEIEIKISKSDFLADKKKAHKHRSKLISKLYFAVPGKMRDFAIDNLPTDSGLITVNENFYAGNATYYVKIEREAKKNNYSRKLNEDERYNVARLGAMRILDLKKSIFKRNG